MMIDEAVSTGFYIKIISSFNETFNLFLPGRVSPDRREEEAEGAEDGGAAGLGGARLHPGLAATQHSQYHARPGSL